MRSKLIYGIEKGAVSKETALHNHILRCTLIMQKIYFRFIYAPMMSTDATTDITVNMTKAGT